MTLGTLVTLPTDIQNPELVNRAKEFIQHTSLDNYLSAIRGWQAMYSPVLKDVLEDVVLKGQSLSPVWVKRRLVAKMSELLSKPDPDAKALDLAQRREYELRIKQVEEMRREGVSEAEIKEYLTNCQKNYPLKDTSLRERTEWAAICGA